MGGLVFAIILIWYYRKSKFIMILSRIVSKTYSGIKDLLFPSKVYGSARWLGFFDRNRLLNTSNKGFVVDGVIRDAEGTVTSTRNTTAISAQDYWSTVAARNPGSAEDFIFDATNIRLRELVLGYSIPSSVLGGSPFRSIDIALVGRNLFFLTNKVQRNGSS